MKEFKNKVAVVTGAASGIGRGLAEAFVAAGMKVVLSDINAAALAETTRDLQKAGADVRGIPADVGQAGEMDELARRTLAEFGAVHVLCNNAGSFLGGGASWAAPLSDWEWMLRVNLMGVVHGVRSFLPVMIEQDTEAHIVNTASLGGLLAAGSVLYGTAKFAVVGLTENLHAELQRGKFKPKVSVLCPGLVDTNILENSQRERPADPTGALPARTNSAGVDLEELRGRASAALKEGVSPRALGERVLDAIRHERFYILVNPEVNAFLAERARSIVACNRAIGSS